MELLVCLGQSDVIELVQPLVAQQLNLPDVEIDLTFGSASIAYGRGGGYYTIDGLEILEFAIRGTEDEEDREYFDFDLDQIIKALKPVTAERLKFHLDEFDLKLEEGVVEAECSELSGTTCSGGTDGFRIIFLRFEVIPPGTYRPWRRLRPPKRRLPLREVESISVNKVLTS